MERSEYIQMRISELQYFQFSPGEGAITIMSYEENARHEWEFCVIETNQCVEVAALLRGGGKESHKRQRVAGSHRAPARIAEQAVGGKGARAKVEECSSRRCSEESSPGRHGLRRKDLGSEKMYCSRQVKKSRTSRWKGSGSGGAEVFGHCQCRLDFGVGVWCANL